jgi:hypothetical protein
MRNRQAGNVRSIAAALLVSLAGLMELPLSAGTNNHSESRIKAAFLLNFPKYVEWPASMLPATNSPYVIAFFGDSQIADDFRTLAAGRAVNGHPVLFRQIRHEEELAAGDFHILFIPGSEHRRTPGLLEKLAPDKVLTVSDESDFLQKGGAVNLVQKDLRIRVQINLPATRKAQLKISSKLLNVADVIDPKD